ncbi:MAG: O-linked N-acetylglucosamine transferase, SPINDLY family protein [Symploca sp. SIO3C6]|nr:O-linked N-acetylglucosamine transferase, SPINDLY family protein [Symploca sp. SIO3C6]
MREINPNDLNNLLQIIALAIKLETFTGDELNDLGVISLLKCLGKAEGRGQRAEGFLYPTVVDFAGEEKGSKEKESSASESNLYLDKDSKPNEYSLGLSSKLLLQILAEVFNTTPLHPASLELAEACLPYFPNLYSCLSILLPAAMEIGHTYKQPAIAAKLLELYRRLDAENIEVLRHLATFYQDCRDYTQGIEKAKLCYSLSQTLPDKIAAIHLLLRGLLNSGGYWQEILKTSAELESLMLSLIKAQPKTFPEGLTLRLLTPFFSLPHIKDEPAHFRAIINQVAQLFQTNIQTHAQQQTQWYPPLRVSPSPRLPLSASPPLPISSNSTRRLKIGYISHCLRRHSVGWLARWLFQHHNRDRFQIYGYFVNYKKVDDTIQQWYLNQVDQAHQLGMDGLEIAEQIYRDNIDILVELDSITLDITSEVMALKPAPIQVTWLGWDASGIPAIDYFIADPYVLPATAQEYYTEKIWRLPQTYIAVDGFEVGVPTLRRDQLNIPNDAIIYLSSQRGYKRHPETVRLQMQILKQVPNSFFLIKGKAEAEAIKNFFNQIAEEEGVECDRLRFLPEVALESIHRANLGIADIVLDTYPYNGATTTLETLWMGIPIVTKVGQQFAARNSYTMMINSGITEGIAWNDQQYLEWGIRLGKDANLRQQIAWKLRQSRQSAPLWNGRQFTREIEKAFQVISNK